MPFSTQNLTLDVRFTSNQSQWDRYVKVNDDFFFSIYILLLFKDYFRILTTELQRREIVLTAESVYKNVPKMSLRKLVANEVAGTASI